MIDIVLPYARLLGVRLLAAHECHEGTPMAAMQPSEVAVGRPGYLHGGAIAGLLEFACFMTLADAVGEQVLASRPVTVSIDYLRGARIVETRACATVLRMGKRIAHLEAFAWQDDREKPVACARMNFVLNRNQ